MEVRECGDEGVGGQGVWRSGMYSSNVIQN